MTHLLIAILLLTTDTKPDGLAFVAPQLQAICLLDELMDEREAKYLLHNPKDFAGDLVIVRNRYKDLKNAPYTWGCS